MLYNQAHNLRGVLTLIVSWLSIPYHGGEERQFTQNVLLNHIVSAKFAEDVDGNSCTIWK